MAIVKNMSAKNSQINYEIDFSIEFSQKLHSLKRASCSKSVAGLLPRCHQTDIRIARIACSGWMITSLLQVVNSLDAN